MPRFTATVTKQCKLPSNDNRESEGGKMNCEIIREQCSMDNSLRAATQWDRGIALNTSGNPKGLSPGEGIDSAF